MYNITHRIPNTYTQQNLSNCPKCKGSLVNLFFYFNTNTNKTENVIERCANCGYVDKMGGFKMTNISILREEKINNIIK